MRLQLLLRMTCFQAKVDKEQVRDKMQSGHIDAIKVTDYVKNKLKIKELDLSGCYNVVRLPDDLSTSRTLRSSRALP